MKGAWLALAGAALLAYGIVRSWPEIVRYKRIEQM
jgi:hypothetical protein